MFEQDYLMRLILQFFRGMVRSWELKEDEDDPELAAETLETAIGNATDMDAGVLLSLSPDSIAQVLQVSGTDPNVIEYVSRGLLLESVYLTDAGNAEMAAIRAAQARALADAYGFQLPEDPSDFDAIAGDLAETVEEFEALEDQNGDESDLFATFGSI